MHPVDKPTAVTAQSPFKAVFDWWHSARDHWQRLHDFDGLSQEDVARMAHDVGMSSDDLRRVAQEPAGAADLLYRRLTALKLAPDDIRAVSPLLLRDLERTCSTCLDKGRCKSDMDETSNPVGWESYCPNSGTLQTLK